MARFASYVLNGRDDAVAATSSAALQAMPQDAQRA
jgi:hypothetical protein